MPKVSVIVPTYNRAELIGLTIESILKQTFADFELIVINDGSTDGTEETIKKYTDPRIKYYRKDNGGESSARNYGLRMAQGEFIAYCDSDDIFCPDHLAALVAALEKDPHFAVAYGDAKVVTAKGSSVSNFAGRKSPEKDFFFSPPPSNILHRRECLDKAGLFDEAPALVPGGADWDMWLRLIRHYKFIHVPKVLTEYHIHAECMTRTGNRTLIMLGTRFYVINKRFKERQKAQGLLMAFLATLPEWLKILS